MVHKNNLIKKQKRKTHILKDRLKEIKKHSHLILISLLFLLIVNILSFFAARYADKKASNKINDLILDYLPTINLEPVFTYGFTIIIAIIFLYPLIFKIKKLHIVISQF